MAAQLCLLRRGSTVFQESPALHTVQLLSKSEKVWLSALQGSSNARYVASRLIPAHCDSTEEQEAQVPVLGALTEEQLAAMLSRQLLTEEASLLQWCRSVGVEPPPPPDNITDALEGKMSCRISFTLKRAISHDKA